MLDELLPIYNNPPASYHFTVIFNFNGKLSLVDPDSYVPFLPLPHDWLFQEVSGLSVKSGESRKIPDGGTGIIHERPDMKLEYSDLVLKRGLSSVSLVTQWIKSNIDAKQVQSVDILIMLLNDIFIPVHSWVVRNAYPVGWEFSPLDATQSGVMTETITLKYESFSTVESILLGYGAAQAFSNFAPGGLQDVVSDPLGSIPL